MATSRKLYSLLLAFVLSLVVTAPAESQVVCWWCLELGNRHVFFKGGQGCASVVEAGPSVVECVRCGGSSDCHTEEWDVGGCHIKCGPEGGLALRAVDGILKAIADDDVARLAFDLRDEQEGFFLEFIPEGGRIEVTLACHPVSPFRTIAIQPAVRESLERELAKASVV